MDDIELLVQLLKTYIQLMQNLLKMKIYIDRNTLIITDFITIFPIICFQIFFENVVIHRIFYKKDFSDCKKKLYVLNITICDYNNYIMVILYIIKNKNFL